MLTIRSVIFNVCFYIFIVVAMITTLPFALVLPRKYGWQVVRFWGIGSLWLARVICNMKVEFRGEENIPDGGFLIASKHQSTWETFALVPQFSDPTFILKQELMWLPLFGWYAAKMRMIPVNRRKGQKAVPAMLEKAAIAIEEKRQILIFPEGTRRPVRAVPSYRYGIVRLYKELNAPVLPIALNSGVFWPRRSFKRYPGTVIVEYLPPIEPGLEPDVFFKKLQEVTEDATERLLLEAADSNQ
ncbi:MAG: 1-acyl-sn-glycerol-3-phosphate acyltransferase [Stappiaceae bacterium]